MAKGNPPRGLNDYGESGFFGKVAPGSLRQLQPATAEQAVAGQLPVGIPAEVAFRWVKEVSFDSWEAYAFAVGVLPIRLDDPRILRRDRRAVLVINSHVANGLWIGHSAGVAVNNGAFIGPNGGAISLPLSEKAQIWAVSTAAGTVASIVQFG